MKILLVLPNLDALRMPSFLLIKLNKFSHEDAVIRSFLSNNNKNHY